MGQKNTTPIYIKVAVDMAHRILKGEFTSGQKLLGRTTLASDYNVSPETIRKSMRLLQDSNIVEVKHGNGIYITLSQKAQEFIEHYDIRSNINELKEELLDLMYQRNIIDGKMNETMNTVIDYTSRFKSRTFVPIHEYCLNYESLPVERTVKDLDFKNTTGITLVGIKRGFQTILSPEDDELLMAKDILLYVSSQNSNVILSTYLKEIFEIS